MASHAVTEEKIGKSVTSHKSRKFMNVTVYFLDDSSHVFQIQAKALGQILFEKTCKFLNLLEVDYFCLEFEDEKGIKCWLDVLKPMYSQIPTLFPTMYFRVKFYSPDPAQLEDELTRYLFGLQVRKDLATGLLQCNDNTAAVIISYIVQADLGDHDQKKCLDSSYFSSNKFLPYQDSEIERKVVENHTKLIGQTPAETDLNLLETARRCELYGIKMTPAKDHEGVPINLAVSHTGVLVFQNLTKITTFSWPKIRKLSFKRKKFLVKLHPDGFGNFKDPTEFVFDGRNECKNFWKKCIENHTFFRCTDAKQGMRQKPKIFSRGSSFRYSGRTQKQVTDFIRENCFKRQPFQRSTSLRTASSSSSPTRALGTFTSAQPLIPVSSQSCGSISDAAKEPPPPVFSTSEPTTPHVAQEVIRSLNNNGTTPDSSKGLISPDFASQQEGFQSPDFLSQDTDDNISHDSYHVVETNLADCMQTNPDNLAGGDDRANGDCMAPGGSNTMEENEGKSNSNLENNGKSESNFQNRPRDFANETALASKPVCKKIVAEDDEQNENIPRRHRVRVYNNVFSDDFNPTLYARANHCISTDGLDSNNCRAYPHTVDFVLVNQLPSIGNFSYKDDSVEVKSPQQIKLELMQWKSLRSKSLTSSSRANWDDGREKPGVSNIVQTVSGTSPMPLDLLSDIKDIACSSMAGKNGAPLCNRDISKESALKVIANNHDGFKTFPSSSGNGSHEDTWYVKDYIADKNDSSQATIMQDRGKNYTMQQSNVLTLDDDYSYRQKLNFLESSHADDVIAHANQYAYTTYRFSHIGRPSESLCVKPTYSNLPHSAE